MRNGASRIVFTAAFAMILALLPEVHGLTFEYEYDVTYLVDVSGSMIGKGSTTTGDILDPLTGHLASEVRASRSTSSIHVVTFADGLRDVDGRGNAYRDMAHFVVDSEDARERAARYIEGIDEAVRANKSWGWNTAIWDALLEALAQARQTRQAWEKEHPDQEYGASHFQMIVLLTDGRDTVSKKSLPDAMEEYDLQRAEGEMGDNILIHFAQLQSLDPLPEQERQQLLAHGVVVSDQVPTDSRRTVVQVRPALLELGDINAAVAGETELTFLTAQPAIPASRVTLTLSAVSGLPPGMELHLEPSSVSLEGRSQEHSVVIRPRLIVPENAPISEPFAGTAKVSLLVSSDNVVLEPAEIGVRFSGGAQRVTVEVTPTSIDLGNLEAKDGKATARLQFSTRAAEIPPAQIGIAVHSAQSLPEGVSLHLEPTSVQFEGGTTHQSTDIDVKLSLTDAAGLNGDYTVTLAFETSNPGIDLQPGGVELAFSWRTRTPWWVWLLGCLGLVAIGLLVWHMLTLPQPITGVLAVAGGTSLDLTPLAKRSVMIGNVPGADLHLSDLPPGKKWRLSAVRGSDQLRLSIPPNADVDTSVDGVQRSGGAAFHRADTKVIQIGNTSIELREF